MSYDKLGISRFNNFHRKKCILFILEMVFFDPSIYRSYNEHSKLLYPPRRKNHLAHKGLRMSNTYVVTLNVVKHRRFCQFVKSLELMQLHLCWISEMLVLHI